MADRYIPFSGPMVQALLAGRKTQTRRVLKEQPAIATAIMSGGRWQWRSWKTGCVLGDVHLLYAPGDRLWVKEAWRTSRGYDRKRPRDIRPTRMIEYLADGAEDWTGRYRHARYMPRWASRLTLHVTDVRVQRLQEISEEDARAEGAPVWWRSLPEDRREPTTTANGMFRDLWNSLHGADAWLANQWVAAISFSAEHANIDSARNKE